MRANGKRQKRLVRGVRWAAVLEVLGRTGAPAHAWFPGAGPYAPPMTGEQPEDQSIPRPFHAVVSYDPDGNEYYQEAAEALKKLDPAAAAKAGVP